jgi:3-oxoacyl-[acyl-carrier-protein] synthase II
MTREVVITGVGVVSPLGDRPQAIHEALCAGRSALGAIELFATDQVPHAEAAEIRGFDAAAYIEGNLRPLDRVSMLSISAARLACTAAGLELQAQGDSTGLVLGTMFGSIHTISEFDRRALVAGPAYAKPLVFANTVINAAAGQTAIHLGLRGVNSTIAGGTVSGLQALGYAADLIRSGRNAWVLAGGVDELSLEATLGFRRAGRLAGSATAAPRAIPYAADRNGFSLGEGAALLVLESADRARTRGAEIHGTLRGFGQAFDPSRGTDPAAAASAMTRAIDLALADAALDAADLGCVFSGANGSVAGDLHEALGVARALAGRRVPISAIKSMTGEALGAAGALQTVAALAALRHGQVAGIHRLEEPDPAFEMLDLGTLVRPPTGEAALITAQGLDGAAAALLVTAS